MPPNKNSPPPRSRLGGTRKKPPPEVMTWGRATPVLALCVVFDALRFMFVGFIFFGPAMAGLYCDYLVSDWIGSAFGLTTAGCATGAAAVGFFGASAFIAFGTVMAMAVGFAGWLIVGGWLMITNSRIFKENALWFVGSLLFSEVPFIGAIPAITVSVWKMHSNQIGVEEAAYKKWEKENADAQAREQNRQVAQVIQFQAAQQMWLAHQQAANDEKYEIPEDERRAA